MPTQPAELMHIVSRRQGLIDALGRVLPGLVTIFWPASPVALCGVSLVVPDGAPIPVQTDELCPDCWAVLPEVRR